MTTHLRIPTADGIELDVSTAGQASNPTVLLLHGFPESSYSWRHQIDPLVDAGYHVVVPDQRGYASSSAPEEIEAYAARHLCADATAVLDALSIDRAHIVGHDWGALVAWHLGRVAPQRCSSVIGVSVPFTDWPAPPTQVFTSLHGDRFFYINYFQAPGVAETEFDADPERFLRAIWWAAEAQAGGRSLASKLPAEGTTAIEAFEAAAGKHVGTTPPWLTEPDVAVYVDQFRRSGFRGPVSWYRNFDTNYDDVLNIPLERYSMPTAFIAGEFDPVIADRRLFGHQVERLPDFRGNTLVEGAGHWVQQEAPAGFTRALLDTLNTVKP